MNAKKIAMILRGHERNIFQTDKLSKFIVKLSTLYDIDFYIHTWNSSIGDKSWRSLHEFKKYPINEEILKQYFSECVNKIKKIIIDDENKIELIGSIEGHVCSGPCPKIAWKRMWYGKYKAIEAVATSSIKYDYVINTRFDILNFHNETILFDALSEIYKKRTVNLTYFIGQEPLPGIDNFYVMNPKLMYIFSKKFHENLDEIENRYIPTWYTEYLVYYESLLLNYEVMSSISQIETEIHNYKM